MTSTDRTYILCDFVEGPKVIKQIACYYFPNYHADARNAAKHGPGWNEWALMRAAQPRFPGHQQPKVPLWGYEDEADPAVFARKIDAAADHGIGAFIFDWYAYEDGLFLERALHEGYLGAPNNSRVKFGLMWANHDWLDIFPARADRTHSQQTLHYPGAVSLEAFVRITDGVIARYFGHPSYWRIDGAPYFSIYDLDRLVAGLGGIAQTRAALDDFRARARAAGVERVHLNTVTWGLDLLTQQGVFSDAQAVVDALGFDSVTTYAWVHHGLLTKSPTTPYDVAARQAAGEWQRWHDKLRVPYHPNVSMGWDSTPRCQSEAWHTDHYPYTPVLSGNTPAAFGAALAQARAFVDSHPRTQGIITINAWNEWTEGSYLEPDTVNGMGYLEAMRR
jgi:hypothetical protein